MNTPPTPLTIDRIHALIEEAKDGGRPHAVIAGEIADAFVELANQNDILRAQVATRDEMRGQVDQLNAQVTALNITLRASNNALDEITTHATTTAEANDLIRADRDEFRELAMGREAALIRLSQTILERGKEARRGDVGASADARSAYLWCAEELAALLAGGAS